MMDCTGIHIVANVNTSRYVSVIIEIVGIVLLCCLFLRRNKSVRYSTRSCIRVVLVVSFNSSKTFHQMHVCGHIRLLICVAR